MHLYNPLFTFDGRINRAKWWLAVLVLVVASVVIGVVSEILTAIVPAGGIVVNLAFGILITAGGIAVGIKRLHDREKSGWWMAAFYIAPMLLMGFGVYIGAATGSEALTVLVFLIGLAVWIWAFVELGCLRGDVGPNEYGPDPLEADAAIPAATA